MTSQIENTERTGALSLEELRTRVTVSVDVGAATVGVGRAAMYEAVKRGEIPTLRIGRRIVIPTPALLRMLGVE